MSTDLDPTPDFLRDPEVRQVHFPLISADDHLVEPPHLFEGRMPAHLADRAPRIVEVDRGPDTLPAQSWSYEEEIVPQKGSNAVAGHTDFREALFEPSRYDEMRPGCYDIEARVRDMDIGGIAAMVNFPSSITGFCGRVFARSKDQELGHACMRAWNDWLFEEWYGPHPDRVIPLGITWLTDPARAVAEIERNAERGFTAVSLPERPHLIGLPSLHSGEWDPVIAACVETDTTVCLHVGSSGSLPVPEDGPGFEINATMFPLSSSMACIDWLWSGIALRHPDVRIVLSEGGTGWLPMLIDRLEYGATRGYAFAGGELTPAELLARNFYFCTLDDPSTLEASVELVGSDHIMCETDYPHLDGTWPDSQELLRRRFAAMPRLTDDHIADITHRTAAAVFRHPLPGPGRR